MNDLGFVKTIDGLGQSSRKSRRRCSLALDAPELSPRELATRFIDTEGYILGSIRESYASPCYGGGEAGPVIGAGGKADEVEPAQVVVQIAGGDAAAGT